ncbi:MAG TPA: hypothetical protein VE173_08690, partial [Longimicrobiales bacterium]|nr:hypothetical protein [Longimicrobiales bacterium]
MGEGEGGIPTKDLAAARSQLADAWERELDRTLRVLRAYPESESELKPHPVAKNARELAWFLASVPKFASAAVVGQLDLAGGFPEAPESFGDVLATLEGARAGFVET